MIVVLAVAASLTIWIMVKRSAEFSRRAAFHAEEESQCRHFHDVQIEYLANLERKKEADLTLMRKHRGTDLGRNYLELAYKKATEAEDCRSLLSIVVEQIDYHAELRSKYERAAAWPWMLVPPDPPEPPLPHQGETVPAFGPTWIP
jgi:hypothetical protein